MRKKKGFTLLELLTVIAIIALLSAIIFPVFARAKDAAYRSSDLSQMNALRSAIQLYHVDQGAYPPQLLGYVSRYIPGGDVIPANLITGFLVPRRLSGVSSLQPSYNKESLVKPTNAFYPNNDQDRAVGTAPVLDLDGNGRIEAADDFAEARQRYKPNDGNVKLDGTTTSSPSLSPVAEFYAVSGYDVALVPAGASGALRPELRYARFWTDWALPTGDPADEPRGHANDDPRQLGYTDPPDITVVTWNSYFRDWDKTTNQPKRAKRDLVLYLGGGAKAYDSLDLHQRSWRILP